MCVNVCACVWTCVRKKEEKNLCTVARKVLAETVIFQ